jgi:alpha-tubulin suppressor-like RCC1 family protein
MLARRSPRPVSVWPPGSGVTAVAAGGVHSCALRGGEVFCWGGNFDGQVGVARPYLAITPVRVPGLPGPVSLLAAGKNHSCAVAGGEAWCWGSNTLGQVGAPKCPSYSYTKRCGAAPVQVAGLPGKPDGLALGGRHSCALVAGAVWCWGDNESGQLGDGSHADRSEPAVVGGIPASVTQLAAGDAHTCAVAAGGLHCWGANGQGQLGDGSREERAAPVAAVPSLLGVTSLAAGERHTCVAGSAGVHCWGAGSEGQLDGVSRDDAQPGPLAVAGLPDDVVGLAAGVDHTCAASAAHGVLCWGDNDFGQLGSGDAPADHAAPMRVAAWDDSRLRDRNGDGRIVIGCLGDSNTWRTPARPRGWCEHLAELAAGRGWSFVNRAEGGATVVESGSMILAADHLDYALENDAVDAVILAYGTNDLVRVRAAPAEVAAAQARLRARAHAADVDVFVALTPPTRNGAEAAEIAELNDLLAQQLPASRIIDFASGFDDADFFDEVHFGERGHDKRARAAWAALSAAAGPVEAP